MGLVVGSFAYTGNKGAKRNFAASGLSNDHITTNGLLIPEDLSEPLRPLLSLLYRLVQNIEGRPSCAQRPRRESGGP